MTIEATAAPSPPAPLPHAGEGNGSPPRPPASTHNVTEGSSPRPQGGRGAGGEGAADVLAILFPERQVTVGGKTLTLREYSFKQSLQLNDRLQPLINAISGLIEGEQMPELSQVISTFAKEHERLIELVAIAADCEASFIENLNQQEGQQLLLLWWNINAPFLIGSAVLALEASAAAKAAMQQAGAASLPA